MSGWGQIYEDRIILHEKSKQLTIVFITKESKTNCIEKASKPELLNAQQEPHLTLMNLQYRCQLSK
jgi:hypothetical protein